MSEDDLIPVSDVIAKTAWIDNEKYLEWYKQSVDDPEAFWKEHGKRIDWIKQFTKISDVNYADNARIKWFYDGTLNACYNCVDRHLAKRSDQTAILW